MRLRGLLSDRDEKRRNELVVLACTPVWIAFVAAVVLGGSLGGWGDPGYFAVGAAPALLLWIAPLALRAPGVPVASSHAARFAVFIAITTFLQSYWGTIFFFDHLGMEYHFPVRLELHRTPVFLYLLTIAYFSTYYVLLGIGARAARRRLASPMLRWLARGALCYAVAFAETAVMANQRLRPFFLYRDKSFTLLTGSLCYGTVFVFTLPIAERLDEEGPPATLARVAWDALAANTLVLLAYEVWGAVLGSR